MSSPYEELMKKNGKKFGMTNAPRADTHYEVNSKNISQIKKNKLPNDYIYYSIFFFVTFGLISIPVLLSIDFDQARNETVKNSETEKQCNSLTCIAEESYIVAHTLCKMAIESIPSYSFRWTNGWTEKIFPHYSWASAKYLNDMTTNQSKGIIRYSGKKIEIQNLYGAWQKFEYACIFDTDKNSVLDVHLYPKI